MLSGAALFQRLRPTQSTGRNMVRQSRVRLMKDEIVDGIDELVGLVGAYTDWTPLDNRRRGLFPEDMISAIPGSSRTSSCAR